MQRVVESVVMLVLESSKEVGRDENGGKAIVSPAPPPVLSPQPHSLGTREVIVLA